MTTYRKITGFMLAGALLLAVAGCGKPDLPTPTPEPTPTPTPTPTTPTIEVPPASQPIFSSGISFGSGTPTPEPPAPEPPAPEPPAPEPPTPGTGDDPGTGDNTGPLEDPGFNDEGNDSDPEPDPEPQVQEVNFKAPDSWSVSVVETKAVDWLTVEPMSGVAGDVKMTVTALANTTYQDRHAAVTIKCAGTETTFNVVQAAKPIPVSSVSLDQSELTLGEGGSATLVATVKPDDAADKTVFWDTSNSAVATVDGNGKVTAMRAGKATIRAKSGRKSAYCKVSVMAAATGLSLDLTELSLTEGDTATLTAKVEPANSTDAVTWSSSDPSVATVDATGKVTAVKAGSAIITAKAGEMTAQCTVTVNAPPTPPPPAPVEVSSVTLNQTSLSLHPGGSATLVATIAPENADVQTVSWGSSNPVVATVNAEGKVTAVSVGETVITAQAGGKTAECKVTVTPIPVASITLNKTRVTLHPGETDKLVATVSPDDASEKTITWTSSYPAAVTVDNDGVITALAVGAATIHASCGGKSVSCEVTVDPIKVESISLDKTTLQLIEGENGQLTATVGPKNATDKTVTWSSSDASIATVDQSGRVTAVKAGSATITAKAGDKTATCTVTVAARVIPVSSVTLDQASLSLQPGGSATLVATVGPENATDKTVTWSSSNTAAATVDANGKVTAVAVGEAIITVKAGDKTAECKVTVNPIPVSSISLNQTELDLKVGESATLVATVGPENATDKTVTWSSSDASIATVDETGKVTAVRAGRATITAKAGEKTATCTVKVPVPAGGTEGMGEEQWN